MRLIPKKRWVRLLIFVFCLIPLLLFILFWTMVRTWPYPQQDALPASILVVDRQGIPLAALTSRRQEWCFPLERSEMGTWLPLAAVAVEDHRFWNHGGIDTPGILGAMFDNLCAGRIWRGGSTITMQVERLRHPRPRTLLSKWKEMVRAKQLEERHSKDELLTEWLNRAPFGRNLSGVGAASWRWFGVSCSSLTLAQAALLAGLPQGPSHLRPDLNPQAALARRSHVLRRMLANSVITQEQFDSAMAEPLGAQWHPLPQDSSAAWFSNCVKLSAGKSGLVRTELDLRLMELASEILTAQIQNLSGSGVDAAAAVIIENASATIRAAVSISPQTSLDLTLAPRSSGSILKPFLYGFAFTNQVCTPESIVNDSPMNWGNFAPKDYDRTWNGQMTSAQALAHSRNIPAMEILSKVGITQAGYALETLGFSGLATQAKTAGLTLAVGGAQVTVQSVAKAYCTLARLQGNFSLSATACVQVLNALTDPERTAGICPQATKISAAWKTGTSSSNRDAWCAAVTPSWTVVVWFGTLQGAGSSVLVGQDLAAPIALKLLSTLDPHAQSWPQTVSHENAPPVIPLIAAPLAISSPTNSGIYHRNSDTGHQTLQIPLTSIRSEGTVWWYVDDTPLGFVPAAETLWWTANPGKHRITATDSMGHVATVSLKVVDEGP